MKVNLSIRLAICIIVFLLAEESKALQIMMKTNDWYCVNVAADVKMSLDVDYMITGMNPDDVKFEARQNGKLLKEINGQRSSNFDV